MRLLIAFIPLMLCAQTAKYPAAVADDVQLKVANNRVQTTLSANVGGSDTVLVVASGAGWTANMLATIDDPAINGQVGVTEIVSICNVVGNLIYIGNGGTCPSTNGRGFDGTAGVAHVAGATVSAFATAWFHNAMKAEVKALETALGPNLQNVSSLVNSSVATISTILSASLYNFPAQTPNVALVPGNNQITLVPVPAGVNGTDVGHDLYVSGGSGTAEACQITGGTGTAGQVSGTIIINCANSHSGAWTIRSATNGAAEAVQVLQTAATGGTVQLPPGVLMQCGTLTVTGDGIVISGSGSTGTGPIATGGYGAAGTQIQPCFANQTLFSATGHGAGGGGTNGSAVARLSMRDIGFANNGLAGVTAISLVNDTQGQFHNLNFSGTTANFTAFMVDRGWGVEIDNIVSSGTASSFFGSTVETGIGYGNVLISHWVHLGTGTPNPVITLQRCTNCSISHSRLIDQNVTITGIGILLTNDCQGATIEDVQTQGFAEHITMEQSTVGGSTASPGWTTISNVQLDCAAGGGCISGPYTEINIGTGVYETSVVNATLTGVAANTSAAGITVQGTSGISGHAALKVVGGHFGMNQGTGMHVWAPGAATTVTGAHFNAVSPGAAVTIDGSGGLLGNFVFVGNTLLNTGAAFSFLNGEFLDANTSSVNYNTCTTDPTGICTGAGAAGGILERSSHPVPLVSLPTCGATNVGSTAIVQDSSVTTWGSNVANGGANFVLAYCNGSHWTVAAK